MEESVPNEISHFTRWAAAMSRAAHSHDPDPPASYVDFAPEEDSDSPQSHPWISELRRYHQEELARYYSDHHYWRQCQRMLRVSRRVSRRRGRPAPVLYQTARFAQWHGQAHVRAFQRATKPDSTWRKIEPIRGELEQRLLADLVAIDQDLKYRALEPARVTPDGHLAWQIHLLDYEDEYDLGLYDVHLAPDGRVLVSGGDYDYGGHCHPHVARDGRLCTGRFGAMRDWLLRDGALELVFTTINQILRTYNPDSPYVRLEELVREDSHETCVHCGATLSEDEAITIDCETYCSECCLWCEGCQEYVAVGSDGEFCHDIWYCEACTERLLTWCDECGHVLLRQDALESNRHTLCSACAARCDECGAVLPKVEFPRQPGAAGQAHWLCPDCNCALDSEDDHSPVAEDLQPLTPSATSGATGQP